MDVFDERFPADENETIFSLRNYSEKLKEITGSYGPQRCLKSEYALPFESPEAISMAMNGPFESSITIC